MTASPARRDEADLRQAGFVLVIVLLVQFALGVAASLWVTIGTKRPWSHVGNVALFGAHAVLGIALVLFALIIVGRSFEGGRRTTRIWATLAMFGVCASLGCGLAFVETGGTSDYSFGMALGWAVALFANVCLALGR